LRFLMDFCCISSSGCVSSHKLRWVRYHKRQ
jgi:hypothetical protein